MGKMSGYKTKTGTENSSVSVCVDDHAERAVVALLANISIHRPSQEKCISYHICQ